MSATENENSIRIFLGHSVYSKEVTKQINLEAED